MEDARFLHRDARFLHRQAISCVAGFHRRPLSNRPRGAPPGMNLDRMFLIAKGLGVVRRCVDRWRQACAAPHPRRLPWAISTNIARRRLTIIRRFNEVLDFGALRLFALPQRN